MTRFKEGMRVRVTTKPIALKGTLTVGALSTSVSTSNEFGATQHPHAGKTGIITELLGVRIAIGKPRAMVRIDKGFEHAGNTMIVSLEYLEEIDGSTEQT